MNQNCNNNGYEILDNGSMSYQPKYPLVQEPGSAWQQTNYKDWINRCQNENIGLIPEGVRAGEAEKTALIITTGLAWALLAVIPGINVGVTVGAGAAAAAGVLNVLIPFLWPDVTVDNQPAPPQYTWEEIMKAVEEITRKQIQESKRLDAIARLEGIQTLGRDYYAALCALSKDPDNEQKKFAVRDAFDDVEDQLKVSMPYFRVQGFEIQMLGMYAQAANLHLTILRDVVRYGEGWGFSQERVHEYYDNQGSARNPGLLQLLSVYTNHCVNWYNEGLNQEYRTGDWNKFNTFRRNMTIMVLDVVAVWPTYDPILYPLPTDSELTRTVYTELLGNTGGTGLTTEGSQPIDIIEENVTVRPQLFRWLRELAMGAIDGVQDTVLIGGQQKFQTTGASSAVIDEGWKGNIETDMKIEGYDAIYAPLSPVATEFFKGAVKGFALGLAIPPSIGYLFFFLYFVSQQRSHFSALPCRPKRTQIDCEDPCSPNCREEVLPNSKAVCSAFEDYHDYSHRLSNVGFGMLTANDPQFVTPGTKFAAYFSYGWIHESVKTGNVISLDKITQIPAVKGVRFNKDARVIKGPGSTGGDLVELGVNISGEVYLTVVTQPSETVSGYAIRIRYACKAESDLWVQTYPLTFHYYTLPATTSDGNLTYTAFNYYVLEGLQIDSSTVAKESTILLKNVGTANIIIDKIEFIPIEGSLEEYQAKQDLEKAREAVNALFTSDAKNDLKLNITDYAVDQAANLVECVSEDFHAQAKRILLDQVKLAKRLSQARNLLNYGDFESSDWSGENGWRTSPHVHVASDNPIFKGRYLHMPGAMSPQYSNNTYPTYAYQKVDESKLKSYTRYLVRGFVGNSKDLELLVERYGKDVHVEMNVPNDIQYSLPMNECGG
ncbi:insecticidal delta-endotoxin Cry8Ea1 family protein, partial [Bacillus cereus]